MRIHVALLALAAASPAVAQPIAPQRDGEEAGRGIDREQNRFNVRVGGTNTDTNGYPVICVEGTPWGPLSLEGCGTGSGFLRSARGVDTAHFRAKWKVFSRAVYGGAFRSQLGIGFAELEIGEDSPGFRFGRPTGPDAVETAGPEASVHVQWFAPIGRGFEAIASVTGGVAWMPYAGELASPQKEWQPFVSFEVGAGW